MSISFTKSTLNNLTVAAFLLVVLFFPRSDTFLRYYFAVVLMSAVILLGSTRKLYLDWLTYVGIGALLVSAASIYLRFGFIVSPNLRDYTEFGRLVLPVVMLLFRDKFKDLSITTLFTVFALYCSIDVLVSVLDFSNVDFMGLVSFTNAIYVSEYHANVMYRIDGLSAGPGQHGATMLVLFIFFYVRAFQSQNIVLPLIFSFFSAIPIFLSQSRTSIIVFAIMVIVIPLYHLLCGDKSMKRRSIPILVTVAGMGLYLFIQFISYFDRILDLARGIGDISSFQQREGRYADFFEAALEHPLFFLIGFGKDYFQKIAFDNEYILMFLVHGPVITAIIIVGVFIFLATTILKRKKHIYIYRNILFFLLFAGLIVAFPTTFFLLPVLIPILFLFINLTYWENKRLLIE